MNVRERARDAVRRIRIPAQQENMRDQGQLRRQQEYRERLREAQRGYRK